MSFPFCPHSILAFNDYALMAKQEYTHSEDEENEDDEVYICTKLDQTIQSVHAKMNDNPNRYQYVYQKLICLHRFHDRV